MAGASLKKIASNNVKILKEIHTLSGLIVAISSLAIFLLHRPSNYKPFILFNVPLAIVQYVLETTGRPKYEQNKLVGTPNDLKLEGLTEYMFDLIYYTLLEDILMIVFGSNKVWWLYLAVPAFIGYKSFWLLKMGKNLLGLGRSKNVPVEEEPEQPQISKRQAKMEARGQKGKRKIVR